MIQKPTTNDTRSNLIGAGLRLFGQQGFQGTSTRDLANHANANVASIAYHFGDKAGLRKACARHVIDQVAHAFEAGNLLDGPATPDAAITRIEHLIGAVVRFIVGAPEGQDIVNFAMRELVDPGEIADLVYAELVQPKHLILCKLWATATGRAPQDEAVKLAVFSMMGQVLYFRIANRFVARRMEWDRIGRTETDQISDLIVANIRDTIERQKV